MLHRGSPPNLDLGLTAATRCSHCRGDTVPVTVDAGAGAALPLFAAEETGDPAGDHTVQMVRPPLRGRLCPNCGLLAIQAHLNQEELAAYRRKRQRAQQGPVGLTVSPKAPTLVKRGPSDR